MGLLDGLLGNVLGNLLGGGGGQNLMQVALELLQSHGGLPGVVDRFKQAGLGAEADSWVGTGANLPLSADDLQRVLGSGDLAAIASRLGMNHGQLSSGLAQMLPELINHLTPQGSIPADHAAQLGNLLEQLGGRR